LVPAGNFTNSTIFTDKVVVEQKPLVTLKVDHGIDLGYTGEYKSAEVNDNEMWAFSYELRTYGTITETLTLNIANFY